MHTHIAAGLLAFSILACTGTAPSDRRDTVGAAGAANTRGALAATTAAAAGANQLILPAGTAVRATVQEPVSSRGNHAGDRVKAIVTFNVLDASGRVAIPGGATVVLAIAELQAPPGATAPDGVIAFNLLSIAVHDTAYTPIARVGPVPHAIVPGPAPTAQRDLSVTAATPITITLTQALTISAK